MCHYSREYHRYAISFTCFTCSRDVHKVIELECPMKNEIGNLRSFVCTRCKDTLTCALILIRCQPGSFDTWNDSGYFGGAYSSQIHIENVDV